jgi:glycosyltransferase involved in cell wall biosynthesis
MKNKQSILFLVPYPFDEAPSQRFRFEQYLDQLSTQGYSYRTQSFLSYKAWTTLYGKGKIAAKTFALVLGFLKRLRAMFLLPSFDYIFIHREAAPVGPPIFEWIIANVFRKKIIYDFDDAIWLTDKKNESALERFIRFRSKVGLICTWSYKVSCGNEYLCTYARQFNKNVVLNPTTIDTERLHYPESLQSETSHQIHIGWTGSHSTLKYLKEIEDVIAELEQQHQTLHTIIIADRKPDLKIDRLVFIPWSKDTEVNDLRRIDIGIMPLPDDEWTKGKCGFKALQYMALEIPSVVSPVGVNTQIIEPAVNGFYATTKAEWISALEMLITNVALRNTIGKNSRKKIMDHYSVRSNSAVFLSLFS